MTPFVAARLRRFEYMAALTAVAFVAGVAALSLLGGGEAWSSLHRLSGGLVAGLLALSLANYALRAWRWILYTRRLGLPVPPARNLLYFIAGFALGTTPGKVGEAFRLWLLERCHGCRYERAGPLFIADRLSDMKGVLLLCLIGAFGFSGHWLPAAVAAVATVMATLAFVRPVLLRRVVTAVYAAIGRRARGPFARLRTALNHTARLFAPGLHAATLLLSVIGWFAECLAFAWLLRELGASVSLLQAMFVFTFAVVVGAVSLLPGGLGGTEATMLALLVGLEVPFDTALAATAVIRATTLWFGVGLGFLAMPFALRLARGGAEFGRRA
jgi:uncharacterized protein (TIRG00374 family)